MTAHKSNDDIPSRMSIPLPFVIMRENVDKEQLVEQYGRVFQNAWRIYGFFMIMMIMPIAWSFIGGATPDDLIAVGRFWLIITVTMTGTVFFQKRQKENTLKEIKNLPKITPFIAITHQDVRVYNRFGKELVAIPIDNIATMYAFDLSGGSKLHIHYKRPFWRFFVYTIGSNEMGATFYFEHQNEKYIPESLKSCVWIISNMVKMLQQDRVASHFPFVKKNYTNGRAWDDP